MHPAQYLRRKQAGEYLKAKFGFGSEKTLAKLACIGGGPEFRKAGAAAIYEPPKLDEWALSKIGEPRRSTSNIPTDEARRLVNRELVSIEEIGTKSIIRGPVARRDIEGRPLDEGAPVT
jgi:hypothetical protein